MAAAVVVTVTPAPPSIVTDAHGSRQARYSTDELLQTERISSEAGPPPETSEGGRSGSS